MTFQGSFWASLGPKTLEEITVISQVSHLIERCELIVVAKYIGSRVVGKLYPCYRDVLNAQILEYACCK